jgi:hypothetical protein
MNVELPLHPRNVERAPVEWTVTDACPGYSRSHPEMQIYHGGNGTTFRPANYQETIDR